MIQGYDKLGIYGQRVFNRTHKLHLAATGTEKRKKYEREQVKSVKANNAERCIEVRFRNGELFKYKPDGTWY